MDKPEKQITEEERQACQQMLRHWRMWLGLDPDKKPQLTEEQEKVAEGFLEYIRQEQQRIRAERRRREQEAQSQDPEPRK